MKMEPSNLCKNVEHLNAVARDQFCLEVMEGSWETLPATLPHGEHPLNEDGINSIGK